MNLEDKTCAFEVLINTSLHAHKELTKDVVKKERFTSRITMAILQLRIMYNEFKELLNEKIIEENR